MREITTHKINGLNEALDINVMDEPGHGAACHSYYISCGQQPFVGPGEAPRISMAIEFQNGQIGEVGVNGISNEALLAIVRDRLEGFQSGPYAHVENGNALNDVVSAMECLKRRTSERVTRGVEGTHAV